MPFVWITATSRRWIMPFAGAVLVLVAGAPSVAFGQAAAAPRRLELADYYRLESAGSAAIAPDGKSVAFVRSTIVEGENRRHSEIWLARLDATGAVAPMRLTSPAFSATNPRWSPDGTLLAFTSRRPAPGREDDSGVWFLRMDRPGGEAFQIDGVGGAPVFSRDNQWIAFTKATSAPQTRPAASKPAAATPVTDADRKIAERFKGRIVDWMQYRVDGRGFIPDPRDPVATPSQELYIVPRSGGTPTMITTLGVNVSDVAWRPDSRAIAFVANTHQRDEYLYPRADLWTIDVPAAAASGGAAGPTSVAPKRLTDDGYDYGAPTWSPDGRTIVCQRQQGLSAVIASKQRHGASVDLYRVAAENGALANLTAEWDLLPGAPQWSGDGRFLYFSGGTGGVTQLFRVSATGGRVDQVSGTPVVADRAIETARDRTGFSFSAALDRVAFTGADALHAGEIYVARLDAGGPSPQPSPRERGEGGARVTDERKLTSFSDAVLSTRDLGRTERLSYKSKDGTPIEGWVMLPPGYDPSKGPYPLILSIHGGPHGAYGPAFSFPFQLLAANNFIVLYTNPRGSTGYGESFLWATWGGGWGKLDTDDVMAGVDEAMKRYAVDGRRLGITGYSYGGFMTNWIITQTRRFAAAAAGAGVSNWISDYGTADIPRTKESEFFGAPWEPEAAKLLLAQSPIMHAAGVTTPTLFVHGESDVRVPMEQAEQMYLALKKQRVPARFVRYPDSFHGGWSPWNTVHRFDQELKWWTQYLRPEPRGTR